MLVVSDVDDVFLPKPTDLLVNLTEARASIEQLLGRLHEMFQDNLSTGCALGPALQAGFKLMVSTAITHRAGLCSERHTHQEPNWWKDYHAHKQLTHRWTWGLEAS
jgi:hypothetical protein